jgi:hypothetical protein
MNYTNRLARVIAHRWKKLPESGRAFYRQVAKVDLEQYERYLAARGQVHTPC